MTTWMIVALSVGLAGAGLALWIRAARLLRQPDRNALAPVLTRRGFLPRLAFTMVAALAASRAARGETLPDAADFLTRSEKLEGPPPARQGHVDVNGPDGSHMDTHADFAHSDHQDHHDAPYTDHSDAPHSDHSDVPHSDHSDVPHSDHSDVPYSDHSDAPHGDS